MRLMMQLRGRPSPSLAALLALSFSGACGPGAPPARAPAARAANLVTNGDFSHGIEPWGAHLAGAREGHSVQPRLVDGALCTPVQGGEELIVGWPVSSSADFFTLVAARNYELSLRVSVSGASPPLCVIKVGHQLAPYTTAFSTPVPPGPTLQPFSVSFAPDHSDDRAGIALECRAAPGPSRADVCIDDVSLR